jgi:NAD-dependent DNA ligase
MDSLTQLIMNLRKLLHAAFEDWVKKNADVIGDNWYDKLMKEVRDANDRHGMHRCRPRHVDVQHDSEPRRHGRCRSRHGEPAKHSLWHK